MAQYNQAKAKYPDAILLFRVGDFYETFGDDAEKAANALGITLPNRLPAPCDGYVPAPAGAGRFSGSHLRADGKACPRESR